MQGKHYAEIAAYYEKWCEGDGDYLPSGDFYLDFLSKGGGVVAELGVGTGRIALPLSKVSGIRVYGVDNSPAMLAQCEAGMAPGMHLKLIQSDFQAFMLPEAADTIAMPFRTIGHILTDEGLAALFAQVRRNLKPGGRFVFDHYMFDKDMAMAHNGKAAVMYEDEDTRIVNRDYVDLRSKTMRCTVEVNGVVAEDFDFRWIEPDTIRALLPRCGFVCEKLYGDFDYADWDAWSPNQIWVLRKSE